MHSWDALKALQQKNCYRQKLFIFFIGLKYDRRRFQPKTQVMAPTLPKCNLVAMIQRRKETYEDRILCNPKPVMPERSIPWTILHR
jgi:hypothetical protein